MTFETFLESNFHNDSSYLEAEELSKLRVAFAEVEAARIIEQKYSELYLIHRISRDIFEQVGINRVKKQNDLNDLILQIKNGTRGRSF